VKLYVRSQRGRGPLRVRSGAFGVFDCRDPLCGGSSWTDAQPLGSLPGRRFANPISAGMCLGLTSRPKAHRLSPFTLYYWFGSDMPDLRHLTSRGDKQESI
jgi:hypothetical protein